MGLSRCNLIVSQGPSIQQTETAKNKVTAFSLHKVPFNNIALSLIPCFVLSAPGLLTLFWCVHNELLLITTSVIHWFYCCYFWTFDSSWHQKWAPGKPLNPSTPRPVSKQVLVPTDLPELTTFSPTVESETVFLGFKLHSLHFEVSNIIVNTCILFVEASW